MVFSQENSRKMHNPRGQCNHHYSPFGHKSARLSSKSESRTFDNRNCPWRYLRRHRRFRVIKARSRRFIQLIRTHNARPYFRCKCLSQISGRFSRAIACDADKAAGEIRYENGHIMRARRASLGLCAPRFRPTCPPRFTTQERRVGASRARYIVSLYPGEFHISGVF